MRNLPVFRGLSFGHWLVFEKLNNSWIIVDKKDFPIQDKLLAKADILGSYFLKMLSFYSRPSPLFQSFCAFLNHVHSLKIFSLKVLNNLDQLLQSACTSEKSIVSQIAPLLNQHAHGEVGLHSF